MDTKDMDTKLRILAGLLVFLGITHTASFPVMIVSPATTITLQGILGIPMGFLFLASAIGLWSRKDWGRGLSIIAGFVLIGRGFYALSLILKYPSMQRGSFLPSIAIPALLFIGLGVSAIYLNKKHLKKSLPSLS